MYERAQRGRCCIDMVGKTFAWAAGCGAVRARICGATPVGESLLALLADVVDLTHAQSEAQIRLPGKLDPNPAPAPSDEVMPAADARASAPARGPHRPICHKLTEAVNRLVRLRIAGDGLGWAAMKLRVDIWSDIACPWCYIGKRRLEAAFARFPHRDAVEVVWHAFELNPSAPREIDRGSSYAERLARKYGSSVPEAERRIGKMSDLAKADGLSFHFDRIRPGNTFDAHRVLHLALERGVQGAVKERLLRGYMTEGEAIGVPEVLIRLAGEAGLDADEVRDKLANGAYADEVRDDEEQARALGIEGVPFFVMGGRYGVSGAQPAEVLLRALTQAWTDIEADPVESADGAVCGPDGCG
jgi:predicted DsbA family dithiol-disulfide isomerase